MLSQVFQFILKLNTLSLSFYVMYTHGSHLTAYQNHPVPESEKLLIPTTRSRPTSCQHPKGPREGGLN